MQSLSSFVSFFMNTQACVRLEYISTETFLDYAILKSQVFERDRSFFQFRKFRIVFTRDCSINTVSCVLQLGSFISSHYIMAAAVFEGLGKNIDAALLKSINAVYQFNVTSGTQTNSWTVDL